jgi:hypothetical protein
MRSLPGADAVMAERKEGERWRAKSAEVTRVRAIVSAVALGLDFAAAPDSAACAQMLEEIAEEADALPAETLVPVLSVRIGCLMYWVKHGLPLPANLPDTLRATAVLSAMGVHIAALVQRQALAEKRA